MPARPPSASGSRVAALLVVAALSVVLKQRPHWFVEVIFHVTNLIIPTLRTCCDYYYYRYHCHYLLWMVL